jgi:hypothetical protein
MHEQQCMRGPKGACGMFIVAAVLAMWALCLFSLALTLPPEFFSPTKSDGATKNKV